MRLCVVAPNEAYLEQAGARIRYGRLLGRLEKRGVSLQIRVIGELRRNSFAEHDLFLISKCYDARALLLARMLSAAGRRVGVDLFDDYFSHSGPGRFVHHRDWLRELSGHLSFALCSTQRMAEVAAAYAPSVPRHVLNDPFEKLDEEEIATRVEAKLAEAQSTRTLRIGWFGIGDNPQFPVGLTDLRAFRETLAPARWPGYAPRLSILTNARALTPERIAAIRALPLPFTIEEWSKEREEELVAQSLFCFIPTNAQNFSVAKSLNRAVTTLTGGSQMLSAGYPLYTALEPFVYRCADALRRDIDDGRPALRRETLADFSARLGDCANPDVEAERFADFLEGLPAGLGTPTSSAAGAHAIIHGINSVGDVHKFAQRVGQFSVGHPLSNLTLNHDIRFVFASSGDALDVELTEAALQMVATELRERAERLPEPQGKRVWRLAGVARERRLLSLMRICAQARRNAFYVAFYPGIMGALQVTLARLLPHAGVLVSENDGRFWVDQPHAVPAAQGTKKALAHAG